MKKYLRLPSPAMAVALLALFTALVGQSPTRPRSITAART